MNNTKELSKLTVEKKLTINLLEIDVKKLFISLLKGFIHYKLGNHPGIVDSISNMSESIGVNNPIARLAFKLYTISMNDAIQEVVDTLNDILDYDEKSMEEAGNSFDELMLPKSFTLDKNSIDDPCSTDFYVEIENYISKTLYDIGLSSNIIGAISRSLNKSFKRALQAEWMKSNQYKYLLDYFDTPFNSIIDDDILWDNYEIKLKTT